MLRTFSKFSIETSFPANEEVTMQNFYKYPFYIYNKDGYLVGSIPTSYVYKKLANILISGSEEEVVKELKFYIEERISVLKDMKSLL